MGPTAGVAVFDAEVVVHELEHFGLDWGGRVAVEVDRLGGRHLGLVRGRLSVCHIIDKRMTRK